MTLFDDITSTHEDLEWPQPVIRYHSKAIPIIPIGHPDFIYYPSSDTDVTRTWRKFGWTPIQRDGPK
ncbi:MAG: hypothetical protein ACOYMN_17345 [Roseimicrobium sp.]|jgi:hypothetical protein